MTDSKMTIKDLKKIVDSFVDERNWKKFHSPKNLSMAISIEASELMELFQWLEYLIHKVLLSVDCNL